MVVLTGLEVAQTLDEVEQRRSDRARLVRRHLLHAGIEVDTAISIDGVQVGCDENVHVVRCRVDDSQSTSTPSSMWDV